MKSWIVVAVLVGCSHPEPVAPSEPAAPSARPAAEPVPAAAPTPASRSAAGPPVARTVDVAETHFGITVADPYRWMEGNDNPELGAWLGAQGDWTRAYLAHIPGREHLLARVRELGNATGLAELAAPVAGRLFYFKTAPGEQRRKVVMRDGGGEHIIVEPAMFETAGGHASIDGFSVSPDGRRLAFNVSAGGGETAVVHVRDLASGKELADRIERVPGGLAATWLADSSGFFYTQKVAAAPGVDPMQNPQTRLHVLGTAPDKDVTVLGSTIGGVAIASNEWSVVLATRSSRWVLAAIAGARSEQRFVVAPIAAIDRSGTGRTPWRTAADYADGVAEGAIHDDRVYLRSYKDASNFRITSVSAAHPDAARVEIAEDPHASLVAMAAARDALYVVKSVNGSARLLRWAWRGQPSEIALPFDGWIGEITGDPARDGVLFQEQGWTHPAAYYAYDPGKQAIVPDALVTETNADYTGVVTDEVDAKSADGTRVPLSILHRADIAHDGARPAIVNGYGGYGVSQTPAFSATRLAWLERGGVYAVCHVRGGGEKGHAWRVDGMQERKMNGVHDLEACAQALIDARLSSPAHVFAQGGSMGGVLIGRAITDRPDLFAAANIIVGVVNPLRLLTATNGATQIPEVGDPETAAGFKVLEAMDPYQHVVTAAYPATMFSVGLNDARVSPWMSGKMAARMQALSTSGKPIVLRVDADAGHGPGSTRDQALIAAVDAWSFFLAASGDPEFVPR